MNTRITHHDLIDVTAEYHHRHGYGRPTSIIQGEDLKPFLIDYDAATRLWSNHKDHLWSTTALLESNDDYYECADCGRVCDNELDPATVILRDRPLCGSCWGAKVDAANEVVS